MPVCALKALNLCKALCLGAICVVDYAGQGNFAQELNFCAETSSDCNASRLGLFRTRKSMLANDQTRRRKTMNDYIEELMEQRAQEWDQDAEDAEEM